MGIFDFFKKKQIERDEDEEIYGVDIHHAHPRARKLIPDGFFWDCTDELAPFGSDEGDTALSEYRQWRKDNPEAPIKDCLVWTIESVGEMDYSDYSEAILQKDTIQQQVDDDTFNDQQYIFTLDISVVATGFGQLVGEGKIDGETKPILDIALRRLAIWSQSNDDWPDSEDFVANLEVLRKVLDEA